MELYKSQYKCLVDKIVFGPVLAKTFAINFLK